MSTEVVVDALPYFDQGYDDPTVRQAAKALVDEEIKRLRPSNKYLDNLPSLKLNEFETDMMASEFELISKSTQRESLNMKRYELPAPPPSKMNEVNAWNDCIDNSLAQLEHQTVRAINLDLTLEYGCDAWKGFLETLTVTLAKEQKILENVKTNVNIVNQRRKDKQLEAGTRLKALEAQWVALVSKNYDIEEVLSKLEKHIQNQPDESAINHNGEQHNGINQHEDSSSENAIMEDIPTESNHISMETNENVSVADENQTNQTNHDQVETMDTE